MAQPHSQQHEVKHQTLTSSIRSRELVLIYLMAKRPTPCIRNYEVAVEEGIIRKGMRDACIQRKTRTTL